MSHDLQGLLERINEEGFKKIESEKDAILSKARAEAETLVKNARAEAETILTEAKAEQTKLERVGADNVRQAARDVMLALEADIETALSRLIARRVEGAMTPETLGQMLVEMVRGYATSGGKAGDVKALVSPKTAAALEAGLQDALAKELGAGATIVAAPQTGAGVKVSFSGESVVHDLTAESIAEMLAAYLNPKIVAILRETSEG